MQLIKVSYNNGNMTAAYDNFTDALFAVNLMTSLANVTLDDVVFKTKPGLGVVTSVEELALLARKELQLKLERVESFLANGT